MIDPKALKQGDLIRSLVTGEIYEATELYETALTAKRVVIITALDEWDFVCSNGWPEVPETRESTAYGLSGGR